MKYSVELWEDCSPNDLQTIATFLRFMQFSFEEGDVGRPSDGVVSVIELTNRLGAWDLARNDGGELLMAASTFSSYINEETWRLAPEVLRNVADLLERVEVREGCAYWKEKSK